MYVVGGEGRSKITKSDRTYFMDDFVSEFVSETQPLHGILKAHVS